MNQPGRRRRSNQPKPVQPPKGNYAFIDSQNLNLGVQKIGWKMDWRRFRQWLADQYGVTHAYMFIGYMAENESLYELMHEHGYLVVLKPTMEVKAQQSQEDEQEGKEAPKPIVKGNIDADLVLYAMKEYGNYDKAVLVSGDGDFFGLVEYLAQQDKLIKLLTPNQRYSTLLKQFEPYIENLDQHRRELAYYDRSFRKKRTA
jgi:uncharacterized LabA/DUF88 family protein